MKAHLLVLKQDNADDWSNAGQRLRFVVVDLEKGKDYPLNFVCLLPVRFGLNEAKLTKFEERFGKESVQVAKTLLTDALESEADEDVKIEIVRRLKLFDSQVTR